MDAYRRLAAYPVDIISNEMAGMRWLDGDKIPITYKDMFGLNIVASQAQHARRVGRVFDRYRISSTVLPGVVKFPEPIRQAIARYPA